MNVSIVVPVYNEEGCIAEFQRRLCAAIDALPHAFDIWYVNDGSTDQSEAVIIDLIRRDPRVRLLNLSRNFGKEAALAAGLDFADGQVVITMDGDGQHPPHLIGEMLDLYQRGFDLVIARRIEQAGWPRRAAAWLFYRLVNLANPAPVMPQSTDFRLMSRQVVLSLRRMREGRRFLRGLVAWTGFRSAVLSFTPPPRIAGASRYGLLKLARQAYSALISSSAAPAALPILLGLGTLTIVCLGGVILALSLGSSAADPLTPGWIALIASVWLLGGAQLVALLLVGQYIALIYEHVRKRPLYLLRGRPLDHEALDDHGG